MIFENIIQKIKITLKEEGFGSVLSKTKTRLNYQILRSFHKNENHIIDWSRLKGKYLGKRIFLIGNGPSLNKTPLYYLKNEFTICFNRFLLMTERLNWNPNFFMAVDDLVLEDLFENIDEILQFTDYAFFPDIHFRGQKFYKKIDNDNIYWVHQMFGRGFSNDLPSIYQGGSVIYEAFQVLKYLGFYEVYFVGVDMNFTTHDSASYIRKNHPSAVSVLDDDPNHFDPRYFGVNKRFHQPKKHIIDNILENLNFLSSYINDTDFKIINAGYDSKVKCFPNIHFESLFQFTNQKKKQLFDECFSLNTKYENCYEFQLDSIELRNSSSFSNEIGNFYMPVNEALKIIHKTIFTHIPLGPYDNIYYFVKR